MRTVLRTVGRARPPFEDADAHYRKLLGRYQPLEVIEARDDADLVRRLPTKGNLVALDRTGRELDSMAWSRWLDQRRLEARDVWLVIGGAKGAAGRGPRARERAALVRAADAGPPARQGGGAGAALSRGEDPGGRAVSLLTFPPRRTGKLTKWTLTPRPMLQEGWAPASLASSER